MKLIKKKTCPKCLIEKHLDEFTKDRGGTDGRGCWCKLCRSNKRLFGTKEKRNAAGIY